MRINWLHMMMAVASLIGPLARAESVSAEERKAILDAMRPSVEHMTNQRVKFVVETLNVDSNWAIVFGEVVGSNGKPLDWEKVRGCDPTLDKAMFAELAKADGQWRLAQIMICSPSPQFWELEDNEGLILPCGVYKGLESGGHDLEKVCRAQQAKPPKH